MRKVFSVFFISILLLQVFAEVLSLDNNVDSLANGDEARDGLALKKRYHHKKINCNYACARRCSKSSRKNVCSRACKTCCARCHCVPPGTYGHHNACPCYASLRTHGNKLKCP